MYGAVRVIYGVDWKNKTYNKNNPEQAPEKPVKKVEIIEVSPEEIMPEGYPDYRQLLQRDGLFVYYWAVWKEHGIIVVNWIRSYGQMRHYASEFCPEHDLDVISPSRQGHSIYQTKYQDEAPDYAVYAAPKNIYHSFNRSAYLNKLRAAGVKVNFNYEYSLGRQGQDKEKAVVDKIQNFNFITVEEAELLVVYRLLSNEEKTELIKRMEAVQTADSVPAPTYTGKKIIPFPGIPLSETAGFQDEVENFLHEMGYIN